ncbi:ABC transporter permease [Brucella pseudintermedia]|uniref:ABC transporter permease n=1 Tax=Brucella pseudintermedia TaxID=370111 RepID=A0ABY5UA73_9HYPH|nr:ABC transporter permease [Brucella pseudintermedia]UWL60236.1 ABC transporter permease [Brucella pseudintermedia]
MNIQMFEQKKQSETGSEPPVTGFTVALRDVGDALSKYRLALIFGWQDVAQRYRRSRVGAFWLTMNMAVFIGALGLIFGTLFRSEMREFLPHLCAGVIVWGFISTSLSEGCTTFSGSDGVILQIRLPLYTHIIRALWRNMIIFAHNIVIFPIIALILGHGFNAYVFLAIPGFLLICLNLAWMMLVLAIVCARFRDMTQVVINILQVAFYATPIMWSTKALPSHVSDAFIDLNPFFHFIQLVRAPLFGEAPGPLSWLVAIGLAISGWIVSLSFFGKYRWRIAYWL